MNGVSWSRRKGKSLKGEPKEAGGGGCLFIRLSLKPEVDILFVLPPSPGLPSLCLGFAQRRSSRGSIRRIFFFFLPRSFFSFCAAGPDSW